MDVGSREVIDACVETEAVESPIQNGREAPNPRTPEPSAA
jgi:hypothetical protein